MTISLCMIVKNEVDIIGRCLDSVQHLIDEIIIVDTGSNHKMKEVCRSCTDRLYGFVWHDDFSAARNRAYLEPLAPRQREELQARIGSQFPKTIQLEPSQAEDEEPDTAPREKGGDDNHEYALDP